MCYSSSSLREKSEPGRERSELKKERENRALEMEREERKLKDEYEFELTKLRLEKDTQLQLAQLGTSFIQTFQVLKVRVLTVPVYQFTRMVNISLPT